jgi:hypothetical protein
MALWTADARETSLKPSAGQKILNRSHHDGAQGSGTRFEAFLLGAQIAVEVVLKKLVESGSLRMPGPVLCRRFGDKAAGGILGREEGLGDAATGEDRLADTAHGGLTSPGGRFAAASGWINRWRQTAGQSPPSQENQHQVPALLSVGAGAGAREAAKA